MDWILNNWLTVLPLIGAAGAWAWAAVDRARTFRRQQDQHEWGRIQELVKILNNEGGDKAPGSRSLR